MHIELIGPEATGKTTFSKALVEKYPHLFLTQDGAWELAKKRNTYLTNLEYYYPLIIEKIAHWGNFLPDNIIETKRAVENISWYDRLILQHAVISKNIDDFVVVWDEGIIHNGHAQNLIYNKGFNKNLDDYLKNLEFKILIYFDVSYEDNLKYRRDRRNSGYMTSKDELILDSELASDIKSQIEINKKRFNILSKYLPTIVIKNSCQEEREKAFEKIYKIFKYVKDKK